MIKGPSIGQATRILERELKSHQAKLQKGMVRGLNKTATSVRQKSSVEVRKTLNVKAGYVKRLVSVRRARRGLLRASIATSYEGLPVIGFNGVRQTKKGVSVRMRKDKPRKTFKGAFKATMPSGHVGVFRRSPSATRRTKGRPGSSSPNLKISELRGPTVIGVFAEKLATIERLGEPILNKNLNREIDFALSK